MLTSPATAPPTPISLTATAPATAQDDGPSFRDVLSALNPLQYLPVVGTIYRAVTGDVVAEPLRVAGSMIASGLMGGPIGVAISAASNLFQHVAGLDLDAIAHGMLASIGLAGDDAQVATTPTTTPLAVARFDPPTLAGSATAAEAGLAILQAQPAEMPLPDAAQRRAALAAYGQNLVTYGAGLGHA